LAEQVNPPVQIQPQYLPIYFGNVCLRFLPVFDIVIHRFLELLPVSKSLETLLDHLGGLYKFHGKLSVNPGLYSCSDHSVLLHTFIHNFHLLAQQCILSYSVSPVYISTEKYNPYLVNFSLLTVNLLQVALANSCFLHPFAFQSLLVVSTWTCVLTNFLLPRLKQLKSSSSIYP